MITRLTDEEVKEQRDNPRCGADRGVMIYVWTCGDDHCDCSQVEVVEMHAHKLFLGASWPITLAKGSFCTDGQGDDDIKAIEQWRKDIAEAVALFPGAVRVQQIAD